MASKTITETGFARMNLYLMRTPEKGLELVIFATSTTNDPEFPLARRAADVDVTNRFTADELAIAEALLDLAENRLRADWAMPEKPAKKLPKIV